MMILASINILILSVLILLVGMIKPKWLLFWMDNPGRMPIAWIAVVLFMVGVVLFGEGNKRKQEALANQDQQALVQKTDAAIPVAEESKK